MSFTAGVMAPNFKHLPAKMDDIRIFVDVMPDKQNGAQTKSLQVIFCCMYFIESIVGISTYQQVELDMFVAGKSEADWLFPNWLQNCLWSVVKL